LKLLLKVKMDNESLKLIEARRAFKLWLLLANNFDVKPKEASMTESIIKKTSVRKERGLLMVFTNYD
jgi:hypothetical protein